MERGEPGGFKSGRKVRPEGRNAERKRKEGKGLGEKDALVMKGSGNRDPNRESEIG